MSDTQYLVSARKYRPQDWGEVVGQDGITQTLKQAISSGQIAQAYLFCGPRGVGKTTSARIFARAINGFDPNDDAMSFNVFELDAASNNKVEDIRSIVEQVRIPPQHGKYKVYIIDEVHMLSQAAFNAFLKTLEEPPAHAVFILATTEKHKILPTILSRCQIFDFHRITVPSMVNHLKEIASKEGVHASEDGLHVIAAKADGALRDALSMFDQLVAFAGKELTYEVVTEQLHVLDHDTYFEVVDYALKSNIPDSLLLFDQVLARGFDAHHFLNGLGSHLRNLMVCRDEKTLGLFEATPDVKNKYAEQAALADLYFVVGALDVVNEADTQYRTSQHQRLLVELAIMKICSLQSAEKKKTDDLVAPATLASPVSSSVPKIPKQPKPVAPEPIPAAIVEKKVEPISAPSTVPSQTNTPTPEPIAIQHTPAAKIKPTGVLRKKGVALAGKSAKLAETNEAEIIEDNIIDPSWNEEPTSEKVKEAWDDFVSIKRKQDRISLVASLTMCEVALDGKVVKFEVKNALQEEQLNSERAGLLFHIRQYVKCADLELEIKLEQTSDDAPKVFLTDKEKYQKMVEKNPALENLRKKLDLDLA
ncbi:MAG: DNA polymerase III subunit gamma/tau [Euryarchaeota archaeon]|nr:DNA polymerase III subunit gamma/tau [Euryarchaeota archaeon]